ncbi:MAG TPA: ribonuclease E inhibitor RraB [Rhizomicrobium sp.]|nr:ribonuclease E inhibitor RraB [Rhizomicrobium sp.]
MVGYHSSKNKQVLDQLKQAGDSFTKVREIDHFAYFPDQVRRMAFVTKSQAMGLRLRNMSENGRSVHRYGVQLVQADIPTGQAMNDVTSKLANLAEACGGEYDGWGCPVVR